MHVPNREAAVISSAKITDYLLSDIHPDGKHKAVFFQAFGYRVDDWQLLEQSLKEHVCNHELTRKVPSPFGVRYVVEGAMTTPDSRSPIVRTVWFIENDEEIPRFVTAYPLRGGDDD